MNETSALLPIALAAAVPLLLADLERMEPEWRARVIADWRRPEIAQRLAEHGDALLFRTPASGAMFVELARAVAALSYADGGITIFGQHFRGTSR